MEAQLVDPAGDEGDPVFDMKTDRATPFVHATLLRRMDHCADFVSLETIQRFF